MKSIKIFWVFAVLLQENFAKGRKCFPTLVLVVCNKIISLNVFNSFRRKITRVDRGPWYNQIRPIKEQLIHVVLERGR